MDELSRNSVRAAIRETVNRSMAKSNILKLCEIIILCLSFTFQESQSDIIHVCRMTHITILRQQRTN